MRTDSALRCANDNARVPAEFELARGVVLLLVVAVIASALPSHDVSARLIALAAGVGAIAVGTRDVRVALAVASVGFLLFTGFLVNRFGELRWDGADLLWHSAVIAAAAGVGVTVRRRKKPLRAPVIPELPKGQDRAS